MNYKVGLSYLREVAKWALVLWLFLPLRNSFEAPIEFGRVALGIVLFVIFSGKLLYDVVFFPRQHQSESTPGKDLLSMIGIVVGIAFLVFLLVFFIALFVVNYMNATTEMP
jgi:energy-coupling factor transporter transmembrane protein EcfT